MSDFIDKIKEEAKAVGAAIDQELTVLEGVDGYDPLREVDTPDESGNSDDGNSDDANGSAGTADATAASDDTEGGGSA